MAFKIMLKAWVPVFTGMTALIAAHVFLAAPAVTEFSPTYDEPVHVTAGAVYWKTGDFRYNGYHHPPFGEMWAAIPLLFQNTLLPKQHPAWVAQRWTPQEQYGFADTFLYKNRVSADRMMAAGRWMQVVLSCVLGAAVVAAALALGGPWAAVFAGLFWAFSPAFLSNGAIVSTDLAFALFFFGFFASLLRFGDRRFDAAAGACLGLAFASKYFALAILPITGLLFVLDRRLRASWRSWLIIGGIALLMLAVVYRFSNLDVFWDGLQEIFSRSQAGRSSFFNGRHGTQGWLLYFPYVFLVKTPLPLMIALAASVAAVIGKRLRLPALLWVPPAAFFLFACVSKVQIGHRHILAVYPFLFVIAGTGLVSSFPRRRESSSQIFLKSKFTAWVPAFAGTTTSALLVWLAVSTWMVRPHFLAYFNEIVGGPANGYRHLTDSNVDWGQGLKLLSAELTEKDQADGIYLCYFGVADPRHYGVRYLDVGSDRIVERSDDAALGLRPSKLAISVTHLQGTYYADHRAFAWLNRYEPVKKIGHSIFLYDFSSQPEALELLERMRS